MAEADINVKIEVGQDQKAKETGYTLSTGFMQIEGEGNLTHGLTGLTYTSTHNDVVTVKTVDSPWITKEDVGYTYNPDFYYVWQQQDYEKDKGFNPFSTDSVSETEQTLNEWQCCPVCKGSGYIYVGFIPHDGTPVVYRLDSWYRTCPKCEGEMIISKVNGKTPNQQ